MLRFRPNDRTFSTLPRRPTRPDDELEPELPTPEPRQPRGTPTRQDLARMQSGSPRSVGRPTQAMPRPTLPMGFG